MMLWRNPPAQYRVMPQKDQLESLKTKLAHHVDQLRPRVQPVWPTLTSHLVVVAWSSQCLAIQKDDQR